MKTRLTVAPRRPDTVSALERGLSLLMCLSGSQQALNASELAKRIGVPRPTVSRLAATLLAKRWLRTQPGTDRYVLGPGVLSLAQSYLASLDVRAAARGPMQDLAERLGAGVYLAVCDGLEMVLIEACRARSSMLSARLDVGSRVPIPNSALGRAYLSALDTQSREALLQSLRLTRGSDWAGLEQSLKQALSEGVVDGFCMSAGEFHKEINSVSVAMCSPSGEILTFNCGGAAYNFGELRLREEVGPALLAMVSEFAVGVGGSLAASPRKVASA